MKEVIIHAGPKVEFVDIPIHEPEEAQVLIKVVVSGSNPKDWKVPEFAQAYDGPENTTLGRAKRFAINQGDDIAGIVEKVGPNVLDFKPGDRVAAFHEMCAPGGSYAEYAIAWSWTVFHLPDKTSFEEAATIPLAALTAVEGLYKQLRLPQPWVPAEYPTPLVVYGASSAVGAFAVKLAKLSNIHPIIAIAGKGTAFVESLIDSSKGDVVLDYRKGVDDMTKRTRDHLARGNYGEVRYGLDAGMGCKEFFKKVIAPGGIFNVVLPANFDLPNLTKTRTSVGAVHDTDGGDDSRDLGLAFCRYFTRALQLGTFQGHPYVVRPGGLEGVEQALKDLKDNKASAEKYVFRIADTPGL